MTVHEEGIEVGRGWARLMHKHHQGMRTEDGKITEPVALVATTGEVPQAVRRLVRHARAQSAVAEIAEEHQHDFWRGFVAGVREYANDFRASLANAGMGAN